MNIQFTQLLQQKGISINNLSDEIKSDIAEYNTILSDYKESINEINEMEDGDEDKIEAQNDLKEIKDLLIETNEIIVEKINDWCLDNQKTPHSAPNNAQNMGNGGNVQVGDNEAKEGDDSWGWLLFGGLIAAVTFGAVRIYKNK